MLIDFHTHRPNSKYHSIESLDWDQKPGVRPFTYGIHPWSVSKATRECFESNLQQWSKQENFLTLGEIGLDRLHDHYEEQKQFFAWQLELAQTYQFEFVILHCVRALDDILVLAKASPYRGKFVFHDANFNEQQSQQLAKNGHYLSFGRNLMRPKSKAKDSFKDFPLEQLFLESDDSDLSLEDIYQQAATLKDISYQALIEQCQHNLRRVFPKFFAIVQN